VDRVLGVLLGSEIEFVGDLEFGGAMSRVESPIIASMAFESADRSNASSRSTNSEQAPTTPRSNPL